MSGVPVTTTTQGVTISNAAFPSTTTTTTTAAHPTTTTTTTHPNTTHVHNKDHNNHPHDHTHTTHGHNTHPHTTAAQTGVTGAEDTTGTDRVVKTGQYVTGLENHPVNPTPIPVVGESHQNRIVGMPLTTGPAPRANAGPLHASGVSGAPVGVGGSLGGAVVLGGQCECLRNGGVCAHPAGKCTCRGCGTPATTVNPGQNVGVSDTVDHSATNPHPM